jgi:hypothetical protein
MSKTKIAVYIPADTKRGFDDGRKLGNRAVEKVPYGIGVGAGFGYGVVEGVVNVLAAPANCLIGVGLCLGARAARTLGHASRSENQNAGPVELS